MAMIAGLLASPPVLALLAFLLVGAIGLPLSGALRRRRFEAVHGLAALCAMRWQDFAQLIEALLAERGLKRSRTERTPGDGGFDLLLERGTSRYLLVCKNAADQQVAAQTLIELQTTIEREEADGAIVATCGYAEPAALERARSRAIEVIAGHALWRQVRHLIPFDVRDDAVAAAARASRQRLLRLLGVAVLVTVLVWIVATHVVGTPAAPNPNPVAPATRAPAMPESPPAVGPAPIAAPASAGSTPALPDPTLTEADHENRRSQSAAEVRTLPGIADASWSTKSTLVVSLAGNVTTLPDALVDDICRVLLQYEEQRYTRLQLEFGGGSAAAPAADAPVDPAPAPDGDVHPPTVRWRQCR